MQTARRALSLLAFCAILLGLLAVAVVPVEATAALPRYETNAERMGRGLPPLKPRNLLNPDKTCE
jgi:hypothetical protein